MGKTSFALNIATNVLWLCGQGFAAGLEPTPETRQVLVLTAQRAETAEFEQNEEWKYEHE